MDDDDNDDNDNEGNGDDANGTNDTEAFSWFDDEEDVEEGVTSRKAMTEASIHIRWPRGLR